MSRIPARGLALAGLLLPASLFVCCLALNAQQPRPDAAQRSASVDTLGLGCAQVLQLSSSDWVAKYTSARGSEPQKTLDAIAAYGKCYDTRTDQLAASLAKHGEGPLMGARGSFGDFERALKDFMAKAVVSSQPPADAVKVAYGNLYEKQFRYQFYAAYRQKALPASPMPKQAAADAQKSASPAGAAPAPTNTATNDADPITQAKNHFGELLGALPDGAMHSLHAAFGEILGPNAATPATQLLVYRYAIFLLEPPGGQPFAPPPF